MANATALAVGAQGEAASRVLRARRIQGTRRHSRAAQRLHLAIAHPAAEADCLCAQSVLSFRKAHSFGCNCRGRDAGNPKFARGACKVGWRPAVRERILGRRLCSAWLALARDGGAQVTAL